MRAVAILGLALPLALASCAEEVSEQEREEQARQASELVREANSAPPPMTEIVPDAILPADLETNDIYGLACSYAPGTSFGARAVAREVDAYMKIDGEMLRFAADPGSRELPARTRSLYNGREYSLRLEIEDAPGEGGASAQQVGAYEGTLWLRDRWDRVVYQGSGAVTCGE